MPDPERTALYRLYGAHDRLLYVGITNNPTVRWASHSATQPWWHLVVRKDVEWFDSRSEALIAEKKAVTAEGPVYDGTFRLGRGWLDCPRRAYDSTADVAAAEIAIRQDVEAGSLQPGTYLVPKRLAPRYAVAPSSINAAMRKLVRGGVLEKRGQWYGVPRGAKQARRPSPTLAQEAHVDFR